MFSVVVRKLAAEHHKRILKVHPWTVNLVEHDLFTIKRHAIKNLPYHALNTFIVCTCFLLGVRNMANI